MRYALKLAGLLVLAAALCAAPALGQKKGKAKRGADPVREVVAAVLGDAVRLEPALPAVFELTDEQRTKITALHQELLETAALQELRTKAKDRNLADADRKQARQQLKDELKKVLPELRARLDGILTADQKALRDKLTAAADEARREVRKSYAGQLKDKNLAAEERKKLSQEAADKTREEFGKRLDTILTADQKEKLAAAKAAGGQRKGARGAKAQG